MFEDVQSTFQIPLGKIPCCVARASSKEVKLERLSYLPSYQHRPRLHFLLCFPTIHTNDPKNIVTVGKAPENYWL